MCRDDPRGRPRRESSLRRDDRLHVRPRFSRTTRQSYSVTRPETRSHRRSFRELLTPRETTNPVPSFPDGPSSLSDPFPGFYPFGTTNPVSYPPVTPAGSVLPGTYTPTLLPHRDPRNEG